MTVTHCKPPPVPQCRPSPMTDRGLRWDDLAWELEPQFHGHLTALRSISWCPSLSNYSSVLKITKRSAQSAIDVQVFNISFHRSFRAKSKGFSHAASDQVSPLSRHLHLEWDLKKKEQNGRDKKKY
ncbi:unnamed protein product [Nezara viridula]|uniref:Uncharacterized protein n=1 Tax=Nezara viridula TaxID=85310 RepID=A0A9P0HPE6_NEZVI|nr:unnamed protein product [Nezara viridula]